MRLTGHLDQYTEYVVTDGRIVEIETDTLDNDGAAVTSLVSHSEVIEHADNGIFVAGIDLEHWMQDVEDDDLYAMWHDIERY